MIAIAQSVGDLFQRDLNTLEREIKLYSSIDLLWKIDREISNSAGNLCLHLCGNLQHFFGTILSKSAYVRNREAEFSTKGKTIESLLAEIQQAKEAVHTALSNLTEKNLEETFPVKLNDESYSTLKIILHLYAHFNYHLGQINYHRRLIVG